MKQLVTFEVQDGENEYRDYGIYDKKYYILFKFLFSYTSTH